MLVALRGDNGGWNAPGRACPGVYAAPRLARPRRSDQEPAQREQVVVLPLLPNAVPPKAAHQMLEQARGAFDGAAGELVVLEPRGDSRERRVVPRLAVGEALVELADEIGRLLGYLADAPHRGLVKRTGFTQQHAGGEIVAEPDGFEVGREKQPARPQHVVPVGVLPVAPGVSLEDLGRPPRRRSVARERGQRREVRRALGQPEMLMARPVAVVPLAALGLTAARAAVRVGAPGVERERRRIVGAETAVDRQ